MAYSGYPVNSEGRITRKIVYEIFVISKSQDFFLRDFWDFLETFWDSLTNF